MIANFLPALLAREAAKSFHGGARRATPDTAPPGRPAQRKTPGNVVRILESKTPFADAHRGHGEGVHAERFSGYMRNVAHHATRAADLGQQPMGNYHSHMAAFYRSFADAHSGTGRTNAEVHLSDARGHFERAGHLFGIERHKVEAHGHAQAAQLIGSYTSREKPSRSAAPSPGAAGMFSKFDAVKSLSGDGFLPALRGVR